jgi:hypothetical protein
MVLEAGFLELGLGRLSLGNGVLGDSNSGVQVQNTVAVWMTDE